MISKVMIDNSLYNYVKSNNRKSGLVHIVKGINSVRGEWVVANLMCGNNMGTQKGLIFCTSNKEFPCKRCVKINQELNK